IRFVVELKIVNASADKRIQVDDLADVERARVGAGPVDADDGHKALREEQFGEVNGPIVVEDLDPLDAHRLHLGDPDIANLADANRRGKTGAPMDADAGVVGGAWIFVQFHRSTRLSHSQLGRARGTICLPPHYT